jgi:hypothetical protein
LPWIHFEVKAVERLNIEEAMSQARRDAGAAMADGKLQMAKVPVVAHRRSFKPWLVTMEAETFFRFLRGDFYREIQGTRGKDLTGENGENGEGINHGWDLAVGHRMTTDFGNGARGEPITQRRD